MSEASTSEKKKPGNPQSIVAEFKQMREQQQTFAHKVVELEGEIAEHK